MEIIGGWLGCAYRVAWGIIGIAGYSCVMKDME